MRLGYHHSHCTKYHTTHLRLLPLYFMYTFRRGRYRIPFCASAMPMWKRKISGPYKFFSQMSSDVRVIRGRRHLMRPRPRCRGFGNKGDLHDWQPHRTSLSYIPSPPSTRLNTSFVPPRAHGKGDKLCHSVCPSPKRRKHTHAHQHFTIFSQSANSHEETGTLTKKG